MLSRCCPKPPLDAWHNKTAIFSLRAAFFEVFGLLRTYSPVRKPQILQSASRKFSVLFEARRALLVSIYNPRRNRHSDPQAVSVAASSCYDFRLLNGYQNCGSSSIRRAFKLSTQNERYKFLLEGTIPYLIIVQWKVRSSISDRLVQSSWNPTRDTP